MTWREVDLEAAVWTIPKERMKMEIEHRIPLTATAVEVLQRAAKGARCEPDDYVFRGHKRGRPLS